MSTTKKDEPKKNGTWKHARVPCPFCNAESVTRLHIYWCIKNPESAARREKTRERSKLEYEARGIREIVAEAKRKKRHVLVENGRRQMKKRWAEGKVNTSRFKGKKHSEATRKKVGASLQKHAARPEMVAKRLAVTVEAYDVVTPIVKDDSWIFNDPFFKKIGGIPEKDGWIEYNEPSIDDY